VAAGEQRVDTATVLFTDVVDSTALRARVGEEAAESLRLTHDALLRGAVESQRGIVVKHTGDGVMATFSAAVDAVSAAVAIQQAVDAHNRRSDQERFEVRVGISVGDVTFDGDDCFGLPVIEAQRLESATVGGKIYCAEIVRHLARGRGGYEFVSVGELALKGIPDPVPAVEVKWAPVVQVAMARETPLPPVLATPSAFDLAGRARELDLLVDAWKESAAGHGRVVLLSGEPGIGKTRLATETALLARRNGALVLAGRCDEEMGLPYQPFVEALRFQTTLGDDVPAAWFGAFPGELVRLVPEVADRLVDAEPALRADPESERLRLFEAVTSWLRTTAGSVPVLLVLDDLHWADRPTLLLLRHLVHETARDQLLIVGTYRSTDLDRSHPLSGMLADLRRDDRVVRLAVDGLTADGVAELLERSSGHELDERGTELADAVFAETAGNPFFVGEIIRHLVESGALVHRDGRWTSDFTLADVGLPEGVREVVGRRINRLDEPAQRLLSVAAVIGQEFGVPLLAAVAGTDEDAALDLLDVARAAGLVNEVGLDRYRFGHALVRATLLEELTTSRRVRTHRKIGEALEAQHAGDLDAVMTDLAHHFGEAAAADPAKAVEYARRAGELAVAASAPDDAVRWFGLARDHLEGADDDVETDVALLTLLARAEWSAGIGDPKAHLSAAAARAHHAGLHRAMVDALLVTTRASFNEEQESDPEKIELLELALDFLDDDPGLRARVLGVLAIELIFVGDIRRGALLDEARELARHSGDPLTVIDVSMCDFNARPRSTWSPPQLRADRVANSEALAAAHHLADPERLAAMHLQSFFITLICGDGGEARAHAGALAQLTADGRNPLALRMLLFAEQMIATIEGRLIEAEALAIEQFELWRRAGMPEAYTYRATEQLGVRREQGRLAEIVPGWQRHVDAHPRDAASRGTIAFALAETGRLDDAARLLDEQHRSGFPTMPDDAGWPLGVATWSEVAVRVGDRDAARALYPLIAFYDGLFLGTGGISLGPAARVLALLEQLLDRPADADRHHADAVTMANEMRSPVWSARCGLDWADALLTRGDASRAAALTDDADAAIGSLTLPALQQQSANLRSRLATR
jgi:predicted ATPase/class 3 adenylate cyclase